MIAKIGFTRPAPKSLARRSAQTAIYRIAYALVRLLAPLLVFHHRRSLGLSVQAGGQPGSVHLALLPEPDELTAGHSPSSSASGLRTGTS